MNRTIMSSLAWLFTASATLAAPPQSGVCEVTDELWGKQRVSWEVQDPKTNSGTAIMSIGGKEVPGELVAIREHGEGYKVNVRYIDPTVDHLTEVVAFHLPSHSLTRMGFVSLTEYNGKTVADTITAFEDAICLVK